MHMFNEPIDDEFQKLLIFFKNGSFVIDNSFRQSAFDFFTKYKDDFVIHDSFFENFGYFWLEPNGVLRPFQLIDLVFDKILLLVYEWENQNKPLKIHKGTPYYFYGMTSMLKGDLDKGLLLMHQACKEDDKLNRTDAPAQCFVSLNVV